MEKHAKTQHIYVIWLLMKKYLQEVKDTSKSRWTADCFNHLIVRPLILFRKSWFDSKKSVINLLSEVWSLIFGSTSSLVVILCRYVWVLTCLLLSLIQVSLQSRTKARLRSRPRQDVMTLFYRLILTWAEQEKTGGRTNSTGTCTAVTTQGSEKFKYIYTMVWGNTRFWLAAGCPLIPDIWTPTK